MYYELLDPGNTEFVDSVNRTFPRFRTARLNAVVAALGAAQANQSAVNLRALLDRMTLWRANEPNEFANRGGTNGVGYRLWMEAKQGLRNNHNLGYPQFAPNPPPIYPGVTIHGIYVPQAGHMEICHGFAYRWAVAAGKLAPNAILTGPGGQHSGAAMLNVLYPGGVGAYPAARAGGVLNVQAGDIIGMFLGPALGHSLVAESPNHWFSANNVGSFGGGVGRSRVDVNGIFPSFGHPPQQVGWVDGGNQWRRPDLIVVDVIYRRIP